MLTLEENYFICNKKEDEGSLGQEGSVSFTNPKMSHYHEGDVAKEALEAASENYFDVPTGALGSTKATKTERPNRAPTIGNKPPTPTQAAPTTPTTKPAPTKPLATSNPPKINQSSDAAALEAALAGTVAKEIIMKELVLESLPIGR